MNRIDEIFKRLREEKKKALITYIAAGDPDMATSAEIALALNKAGADIIELGIPFSDPLADGPTIQRAAQRALSAGCTVPKVLSMVKGLRKKMDTPIVFMTYYNIVFNFGVERFVKAAKDAGADGLIVPDLPLEEASDMEKAARAKDFHLIYLTAPTTSVSRFREISARSGGFVYYVSLTGVTGARKDLPRGIKKELAALKKVTKRPVCVGFGVSGPEQAEFLAGSAADGVIVGSAIINVIEKNLSSKRMIPLHAEKFVRSLARAVHGETGQ